MTGSPFQKMLLAILVGAAAVVLLLNFVGSRAKPEPQAPPKISRAAQEFHYTPPAPKISAATNSEETETETDPYASLKIPREQAEAWLAKHHRNAASLLAVFRAQHDTNYLNEAATNFPGDPRVQLAILSADAFPAERRKWLDAFKQSSPSNSLANYFSAQNYFKEGKNEEAVQELLAASGKPQFDNHAIENQLDAEELYTDSGKSARDVATLGLSSLVEEDEPQLSSLKQVDMGIADLMKQKTDSGDASSAANLAQMGLSLADKINSGDSGKIFINQLVGMATEAIMLNALEKNMSYDFLDGQTPAQALAALKEQKKEMRQLAENISLVLPQMSEAEMASFAQRQKIYGEIEAFKWAIQLHPPADAQK